MKKLIITLCGLLAFALSNAQTSTKVEMHLWPDGAPNNNEITAPEEDHTLFVVNVTDPILTVYVPENPSGLAILDCPGGSYVQVWQGTEGHNMAEWYNAQGVTYAVLKYRLPNGHCEVPLTDVHRAMQLMKERQEELRFKKLGIQGCSAGGHLASTAATHYTSADNRPDFQILFYPVISFNLEFTHMATRESLIGREPSEEQVLRYSNELQVTADTPPAIILASSDDGLVPVRNSVEYYNALVANKVPATLLLYPVGGHGWFGNTNFAYREAWLECLKVWLRALGG